MSGQDLAGNYGRDIVEHLEVLEILADVWDAEPREWLAAALADHPDATPARIAAALDLFDEEGTNWEDHGGPVYAWVADALEFTQTVKRNSTGSPLLVDRLTVVVTVGGPHAEIEFDASEVSACVGVYWGGDTYTRDLRLETVAAQVWDLGAAIWGGE